MTRGAVRHCANCGQPLAAGAAFCRACGTRYEEPPAPAPEPTVVRSVPPAGGGHGRAALWVAAAIVLIGAGAAVAILLASSGSGSSTTVLVDSAKTGSSEAEGATDVSTEGAEAQASAGAPEAGRYVQAGSFKTVPHAEAERRRLAGQGIDVQVISSDGAEELYPGFQVLLAGPLQSGSEEAEIVKALHRNGVPSAFAREVSPASELSGSSEAAGSWSGELSRSSGEEPDLNGPLTVSLEMESDGRGGVLEVEAENCQDRLSLEETGSTVLSYSQASPCLGRGEVLMRPGNGQLMLTLQPSGTDILILGTLGPG